MNTLLAVIIGVLTVYLAYTFYARRIDRHVIQSDPKRATPATLYMDGVDFMPTNKNILFGYHFKSIAAAGPIVGAIVAATLWGWLPALMWLVLGVTFIGWASDYSGIVISVRNDGNSLSATAHRLVSARSRTVLLMFIVIYLLIGASGFLSIMANTIEGQPRTVLGIVVLTAMGLLLGQMLYRWRSGLVGATVLTVGVTLLAILAGPWSEPAFTGLNGAMNSLTAGHPLVTYFDPTAAGFKGGEAAMMPSLLLWALAICVFCYAGSVLPIWRMAQPVIYVAFWISATAIVLGLGGAALATFVKPEVAQFTIPAFKGFNPQVGRSGRCSSSPSPAAPSLGGTRCSGRSARRDRSRTKRTCCRSAAARCSASSSSGSWRSSPCRSAPRAPRWRHSRRGSAGSSVCSASRSITRSRSPMPRSS